MADKIKVVIVNENTLAYIYPNTPESLTIMSELAAKGGYHSTQLLAQRPVYTSDVIRLARPADFDTYRMAQCNFQHSDFIFENN